MHRFKDQVLSYDKMETMASTELPELSFDKLPLEFAFPGAPEIVIRAERLAEKHWLMLLREIEESLTLDTGFAEDYPEVMKKMFTVNTPGFGGIMFLNASNNSFIASMGVLPAVSRRSEKPLYCGGFIFVNRAFRGRSIAFHIMKMYQQFAKQYGYIGSLSRATAVARSLDPAMRLGCQFLGIIPWSAYLKGRGWYHTIIVHGLYDNVSTVVKSTPNLPALNDKMKFEKNIPGMAPTVMNLPTLFHHRFGKLEVSPASQNEFWKIQGILRQCALEGDGFGLDEFNEDGLYNEKLIGNCCYWVVKKVRGGEIVAAVLSGEARISRCLGNEQAAGVIVVLKHYRKQGLGSQLLEFCQQQCQFLGNKGILTDILACNHAANALLTKHGFSITGAIPSSCVVLKGEQYRYMNSNVHWKPFTLTPPKPRL